MSIDPPDGGDALRFHEPFPPLVRLLVGAAGAATFLAPYELLIASGVPVFRWAMIPFWLISTAALSIGIPCLLAVVLGPARTVTFDPAARLVRVEMRGGFGLARARRHAFADIEAVTVRRDDDTDGPPAFFVELSCRGAKRRLRVTRCNTEVEANAIADRLRAVLAPTGQS